MATYETGTADDVTDLLSKLRTFAGNNGWTEDNYGARTSGSGNALQIHKDGQYVTFKTDDGAGSADDPGPFIGAYAHDTYGAGGTENQAGASAVTICNGMAGPFAAYHFISGSEKGAEYLYCIVETAAAIFKHFGTGMLVKAGEITTGQFVYASRWNYTPAYIGTATESRHSVPFDSHETQSTRIGPSLNVRVDAESISPRWLDGANTAASADGTLRGGPRSTSGGPAMGGQASMMAVAASALTGRNMIYPCFLHGSRTGGLFNPLGYPPGIRWVNMTYLEPNDVMTLGTEQWKVFPVIRKNGGAGQPNSGIYGYAYRVN